MIKKIFIASASALAVVLLFTVIYNISFKGGLSGISDGLNLSDQQKEFINQSGGNNKNISAPKEKIYALNESAAVSPTIYSANSIIAYFRDDENVYEISFDGATKKIISPEKISGVSDVIWSPNKNSAIVKTNSGFLLYENFWQDKKNLKSGMDLVAWASSGNKILYKYFDAATGTRSLNISDPDGSGWKKITDLGSDLKKISLVGSSRLNNVFFWAYPDSFREGQINLANPDSLEIKSLGDKKFGADFLLSPNGDKILVSFSTGKGSSKTGLAIIDKNGENFKDLQIPTMVSRCVWSQDGKTIFYALPAGIGADYVLPNDYQSGKIKTEDSFWKINIETAKKERVADLDEIKDSYDAENLLLSPSEDMLFFVNRIDGKLYGVKL